MNAFFKIIIITAGIGLAGNAYATILTPKMQQMQKETLKMVVDDISAISNNWDMNELEKRSHPTFMASKSQAEWTSYFDAYKALGKLKAPVTCQTFNYKTHENGKISAGDAPTNFTEVNYDCTAQYTNDNNVKIHMQLVRVDPDGPWQIFRFALSSAVFTKILRNT